MSLTPRIPGIVAGALLLTLSQFPVSGQVMFNSVASPLPGNVTSQAFQANHTAEFGTGIVFAPATPRIPTSATVVMSSFACVSGYWISGTCATPPGSTFMHPLTLNIYAVGPGNSVGALLQTTTQTFTIPYRPSADPMNCANGDWFQASSANCFAGLAVPVTFSLPGTVTLPNQVIVTVAFNTSQYGAAPLGTGTACFATVQGCPYDSLNVSAETFGPTVGTFLDPTSAYLSAATLADYCPGGPATTGTLRLDPACWTGFQPQIRLERSPISPDAYQISYAANLAIGDSVINFSNTGASSTIGALPALQNGNICANIYTYSPDEQLVSCCSCYVTPNGLNSLSVKNDLASNTLTPIVPSAVVVKILATVGGTTQATCNPATAGFGNTAPGLASWGSRIHALPVSGGTSAGTYGITETPFSNATLTEAEFTRMTQLCAFIKANGSGYGICKSCQVGGLGAAKR